MTSGAAVMMRAARSGCLTFILAWVRTWRPRDTRARTASIFLERPSSIAATSASGQSSRCTLSRPPPVRPTRFWYIVSAAYGVKGAVSFETVTRHS